MQFRRANEWENLIVLLSNQALSEIGSVECGNLKDIKSLGETVMELVNIVQDMASDMMHLEECIAYYQNLLENDGHNLDLINEGLPGNDLCFLDPDEDQDDQDIDDAFEKL